MSRVRLYVAVVLVVVAVPVTGLVAVSTLPAQEDPRTGTIGQNASDELASMDGFNATVETTFTGPNGTRRSTVQVSARPGTGSYREVPVSSDRPRELLISNGSAQWTYDRGNNTVTVMSGTASDPYLRQAERVERLFTRLNVSRAAVDERKTVSARPVIRLPVQRPSREPTTGRTNASTGNVTLVYNGTATVGGRETYVLEITTGPPPESATGTFTNFSRKLYVDTEWFLPLRTEASYEANGDRYQSTRVLRNVSINPGLDDSLFTFTPPEDARVVSLLPDLDVTAYSDPGALADNTTIPVPEPELPDSFRFDRARLTTGELGSLSLSYVNDTATVGVGVTPLRSAVNATPNASDPAIDTDLRINGENATYRRFGTARSVQWSCAGYQYSVTGRGVGRDFIVRVAESIECGG